MSHNLITAGVIDPRQFSLDEVRHQVATFLNIPLQQIDRVECWHHQIWVKLVESRAIFVSYRNLPLWIDAGLAAIGRCTSRSQLDELGEIFRRERDWYDQHDQPEAVQHWRQAWAKQAESLRNEEERLKPIRAHQEAGQDWYGAWKQVLYCCRDFNRLQGLAGEINQQSQEFQDLPEIMRKMQQLWHQRWQDLSSAIA